MKVMTKEDLEIGEDVVVENFLATNENLYSYACSNVNELSVDVVEFLSKNAFGKEALYEANILMEKNAPLKWFSLLFDYKNQPGKVDKIMVAYEENMSPDLMRKYLEAAKSDFDLKVMMEEKPSLEDFMSPEEFVKSTQKEDVVEEEETALSEEEIEVEEISETEAEVEKEVKMEGLMEEMEYESLDVMSLLKKDTLSLIHEEEVDTSLDAAIGAITKAFKYQSETSSLIKKMKEQLLKQDRLITSLLKEKEDLSVRADKNTVSHDEEIKKLKLEMASMTSKKEYYEEKYNKLASQIKSATSIITED